MFNDRVTLIQQDRLDEQIYRMTLAAPDIAQTAQPGQFVNLYSDDKSKLLPRPISICDVDPKEGILILIYAVVGAGTKELSQLQPGDTLRVMGPLGKGFPLEEAEEADEIFIVGGGLGMPPLLYLSRMLTEKDPESRSKIKIFLGFRSEPWMGREFEPYGTVYMTSDDGASGFKGNVLQRIQFYLKEQNQSKRRILYTCGPIPMMHAIQRFFEKDETMALWFSLEERMGCGFGACAGCPARLRMPDGSIKREGVCKLGPVFPGKAVIFYE
ncbi:MAG: dihydroorotate dehydrogenase electron transfer subunit [Lachnospiraceae bacterium]|jgi:dihydroorotate dehydrogenase electron transfer subunit|nr:dihydroorotate dehydrogenase electron transfer subunit [Lachnospiraceae bacterium]